MMIRCSWGEDEVNQEYHDHEWGVPIRNNDEKLFEALTLELMQSGLSWKTIMKKRQNFKVAFSNWDYNQVSQFDQDHIERLVQDSSIIRHRKKIEAVINNAQQILAIQAEFGSFSQFIWRYTEGVSQINHWQTEAEVPAKTDLAETISRDLKRYGFKFVGPTTTYAFMQAIGMVNDHIEACAFKGSIH
ncbi:DNA-3-methyladenine glycosylase I [Weissella minor]|uniref:Putative 3-methyladenine DNA glycosylase I, constitutive n=1 Tax=Weissella minor TaxID=1620 RepID=A0A0R2JGR8_9LACO|nr:putative 3-methyladenine DNA glycosylase I, constitutive [Weissella minor]